jgi:hypothetical protein
MKSSAPPKYQIAKFSASQLCHRLQLALGSYFRVAHVNGRSRKMESSPSSNPSRIKLQVVIATETAEGQVNDLRKFLHITHKENDIALLITEVDKKFRNLYPSERYPSSTTSSAFVPSFCPAFLSR